MRTAPAAAAIRIAPAADPKVGVSPATIRVIKDTTVAKMITVSASPMQTPMMKPTAAGSVAMGASCLSPRLSTRLGLRCAGRGFIPTFFARVGGYIARGFGLLAWLSEEAEVAKPVHVAVLPGAERDPVTSAHGAAVAA